MTKRVLIAGESWVTHSIHTKGFDSFTTTEYNEGVAWLKAALEGGGWDVTFLPNHLAARDFPQTPEDIARYDVVMLSDIGANTLLLHPDTFVRSKPLPNRLQSIREYVKNGGGLVMIGGYLTFQGIEAKGKWAGSPVEEALPVTLFHHDDRVESPQGVVPHVGDPSHAITAGLPAEWPATTKSWPSPMPKCSSASAVTPSLSPAPMARAAPPSSLPIAVRTGPRRPSATGAVTHRCGTTSPTGFRANE